MDTWIESSDVLPMFPTFVWKTQVARALHEPLNTKILQMLQAKRQDQHPLSPGEAWQSDQALHESEQLRELDRCINAATTSVLRFLHIGCDTFEITACWANVYARGASHRMHNHPDNFLSGVYYVKTAPVQTRLIFMTPGIRRAS